jgi:hypothetical protein
MISIYAAPRFRLRHDPARSRRRPRVDRDAAMSARSFSRCAGSGPRARIVSSWCSSASSSCASASPLRAFSADLGEVLVVLVGAVRELVADRLVYAHSHASGHSSPRTPATAGTAVWIALYCGWWSLVRDLLGQDVHDPEHRDHDDRHDRTTTT